VVVAVVLRELVALVVLVWAVLVAHLLRVLMRLMQILVAAAEVQETLGQH
jgi:hypothetical protein